MKRSLDNTIPPALQRRKKKGREGGNYCYRQYTLYWFFLVWQDICVCSLLLCTDMCQLEKMLYVYESLNIKGQV